MRRYKRRGPKYPAPDHDHFLVAVDLGKVKLGVAVFLRGELVWADTVIAPRGSSPSQVAKHVLDATVPHLNYGSEVHFVCEWPMKYPRARIYHKNLDELYEVGYRLGELVNGWSERYKPSIWKGNVPKAAHHRRLKKVLKPHEWTDKMEQHRWRPRDLHDTWDAIGIGLFALGRTQAGGVV